ncbi:Protein kinase domain [Macleaya cordata]|uniref:Protein kinase domain n=1 Tax=Macleaya cordata TaxID=56857 RepID=A0A200QXS8_MACCD|nr:Protein kinase domain [Macleaya cordata]
MVNLLPKQEEEALLGLKLELLDTSNSLYDWSKVKQPDNNKISSACSWSGITCTTSTITYATNNNNYSTVTGLDLSQKNLSGSISGKYIKLLINLVSLNLSHNSFSGKLPQEIFTSLPNLTTLDISRNSFNGNFPSMALPADDYDHIMVQQHHHRLVVLDAFSNSFSGSLPVQLTKFESLKVLNLGGSYFEGRIPSWYGSFKSLEFLHLAGNLLEGEIPPELGNLKTLTHMEIGYNSYQGNIIPWQLGSMTQLQYLDIAGANLSGSIPNHLCNLTSLQSLFLFRNQLIGSIPSCFGNIISLQNLDLSDNLITGSIPKSFAGLKNLHLLSLMYNGMTGSIPEGIADLPQLEALLIWNNFFSGALPQNLGKNCKLKWVDVSSNNLTGNIPPDICNGNVMLSKLILFSNNFTGRLSPSLTNCSSLVRLRIEDNSFSGDISPLKFSLLNDITYVDLSRNRFTGGIPKDTVSQAFKLQYFNVSHNPDLGGFIPGEIWSLPSLVNFSASSCSILGNFPAPPLKSECSSSITMVELSRNNLSGTIPESAANCKALRVLDLSHNKLNGSIPIKFGNSSSLVLLNISFNEFSGSVPQSNNFRFMGTSAFLGNPDLCGEPLQPCFTSLGEFRLGRKNSEKLRWILLLCVGVVLFIVMSVLGIFYLHRQRDKWKMVPFTGFPQFTAKDILRSLSTTYTNDSIESQTVTPPLISSAPLICKSVLPTGITVSVKKVKWDSNRRELMSDFINLMGNARQKNLVRLLGLCSNKNFGYLLYDYYLPNESLAEKMIRMKTREPTRMSSSSSNWAAKFKIVIGVARGLCYLHHDCYPPIPHGDLKASNVVFDEGNMEEPHLADFGLKTLLQMNSWTGSVSGTDDELRRATIQEEIHRDIYSFGEVLLEIVSNGRLRNAGGSINQSKRILRERILSEIYDENDELEVGTSEDQDEIKLVFEVALLCMRSKPSDRPSMDDALKLLLSGGESKPH